MTRLWILIYLVVGIAIARWNTARSSRISRTDAFALIVVWDVNIGLSERERAGDGRTSLAM
jgi:hypothetical protein